MKQFLFIIPILLVILNSCSNEVKNKNESDGIPSSQIIGKWADKSAMPRTMIFFKRNDSLLLKSIYEDGSGGIDLFIDTLIGSQRRFSRAGWPNEEWYIIEENGNLGVYGVNGKYWENVKL